MKAFTLSSTFLFISLIIQGQSTYLDNAEVKKECCTHIAIDLYLKQIIYSDSLIVIRKETLNDKYNKAIALRALAEIYAHIQTDFNKSLKYSNEAIKTFQDLLSESPVKKDNKIISGLIESINNVGVVSERKAYYYNALKLYLTSLKYSEEIGDSLLIAQCYTNIASVLDFIGYYTKSNDYYSRAIKIFKNNNDSLRMAECYKEMGLQYIVLSNSKSDVSNNIKFGATDTAFHYTKVALDIFQKYNKRIGIAESYENLGYLLRTDHPQESIRNYRLALQIFGELENKDYAAETYVWMGDPYVELNQYDSALFYVNKGLLLAKEIHSRYTECYAYLYLSKIYDKSGDIEKAYYFLNMHDSAYFDLFDPGGKEMLQTYEVINEFEQIQKLQLKLVAQRDKYIYLTIISILVLLSFIVIIAIVLRNKIRQKVHLRDAIIEGGEKERQRLGEIIHDSICSELSAIYMQMDMINKNGDMQLRKISLDIKHVNESIRSLSHELYPIVLINYGLITAIRTFGDKINTAGILEFECTLPERNIKIDKPIETIIYRVFLELMNNVLKHSNASKASVNLSALCNEISLTMSDNGQGFNENQVKSLTGIGLSNIKSRVALCNGSVSIDSNTGKGTTIEIKLPINLKQ